MGCNTTCDGFINGWYCENLVPGSPTQCVTIYLCGNGEIDYPNYEVCDDGTDDGLGCKLFCIGT